MKKAFQFMLIVFVYGVLFAVANAALPFSQGFKDMSAGAGANPLSALYLFLNCLFVCLTIALIAHNASWRGWRRVVGVAAAVFLIASFMTQIETLFFGDAFTALSRPDVLLIMLAPLPSIAAATLLGVKFFGAGGAAPKPAPIPLGAIAARVALLGLIYTAVYFLFGYFVAWRFEELRLFYSGSTADTGLLEKLAQNFNETPLIYPFQFLRGMLFAAMTLPLLSMLRAKRGAFLLGVCLTYLTTAVVLIIPNPLFPDVVRLAHLAEMSSSMLLFGLIAGLVLYIPDTPGKSYKRIGVTPA